QGPVLPGGRPGPGELTLSEQAPSHVVLVRPHRFRPNPQTAADNAFQHDLTASGRGCWRCRLGGGTAQLLAAARDRAVVPDPRGAAVSRAVAPPARTGYGRARL